MICLGKSLVEMLLRKTATSLGDDYREPDDWFVEVVDGEPVISLEWEWRVISTEFHSCNIRACRNSKEWDAYVSEMVGLISTACRHVGDQMEMVASECLHHDDYPEFEE